MDIARFERERDTKYQDFETSIVRLQERSDRKNLMIAKRLDNYEAEAEGTEAKIEQVASAMELNTSSVMQVLGEAAAAVKVTDGAISHLQYVIRRGGKVYNETLRAFKEIMAALGVPADDIESIGFEPLSDAMGATRTVPSGLSATS
jgi:methyl-accepting chemotaxis protein